MRISAQPAKSRQSGQIRLPARKGRNRNVIGIRAESAKVFRGLGRDDSIKWSFLNHGFEFHPIPPCERGCGFAQWFAIGRQCIGNRIG